MSIKKNQFIILIILIQIIFAAVSSHAINELISDPDNIEFNYEYYGVPSAKIGRYFSIWQIYVGGFLETRNEHRFTITYLPNHNWRGFAFMEYKLDFKNNHPFDFIIIGIEHESSHPTMGYWEKNNNAYEMIYDNNYRSTNMNSLNLKFMKTIQMKARVSLYGEYQYYFYFT